MDISIIKKAGLSDSQAGCYLALIENGTQTPVDLAEITGENRTNTYAILNKLVELNLAIKNDTDKKTTFTATHPSNLEALVEKRRKIITKNELEIKQNISSLINLFYEQNELPGVRTLEGPDGIRSVYNDVIRTKKDLYLIRTTADTDSVGKDFLEDHRKQRVASGINTYALTPMTETAIKRLSNGTDKKMHFYRTFLPNNSYDAPVEINIYGDKIAIIAYGNSQIATIINSPLIAEAMRQIHKLITNLIRKQEPDYRYI